MPEYVIRWEQRRTYEAIVDVPDIEAAYDAAQEKRVFRTACLVGAVRPEPTVHPRHEEPTSA